MSDPSDNPLKRLISEIHRRSLWQVLGIYVLMPGTRPLGPCEL